MSAKLPGGDGASDAPVSEPRLDYLGLFKHFAAQVEGLSAELKGAHPKGTRLAGNLYSALIAGGGKPARTISAAKWLKLRDQKIISNKMYLRGVTVSVKFAEETLSKEDLKKVVKKAHSKAGKSLTSLKHLEGAEAAVLAVIAHIDSVMKDAVEGKAVEKAAEVQGRAA